MLIVKKDAKMLGHRRVDFWICDDIAADIQYYNWKTGEYETLESKTSQRYFVDNLHGLTADDSVNLYINSMGGDVKEALGIHSVLQRCPATVTAYIDGFAASAASVIAMAAQTVIMPRNTAMMIHNASWWAYGNPAELRKSADDLEVINRAAIESYTMHAGDKLAQERLQQMLDAETWLTAEECVECGLADRFADKDADTEKVLELYSATAQAAAEGRGARMFRTPPAFLAGRFPNPEPREKQGTTPENKSSLHRLLESMTA